MNWVRAIAAVLVLWSSTAWAATLTWNANSDQDLAGYRVYQCSLIPCSKSSGNASLLATLGTGTSFNIGTPAVTQYYFITAYDFVNNESSASNITTFTPAGATPPPSSAGTVYLNIVGNPATGPWGVTGSTTDTRDVMATVRLDGVVHHVEHTAPYGFPDDNGTTATTGLFGTGSHKVEFVFYLEGTTTEIGRASVTVQEGSPPPSVAPAIGASPTNLSFTTTQGGSNPAPQTLNISNQGGGTLSWTASDNAAWMTLSPTSGSGNGAVTLAVTTGSLTAGSYSGTVTVSGGTGATPVTIPVSFTVAAAVGTVNLKVVGNPATGPWGVEGSTTDTRDVMATVRLDGAVHHVEHNAPYGFPNDNGTTATTGLFGTGSHTVEFVFYLEGTTTEIGRTSVTVKEGKP